ncbi:MAG: ABC transporter substrate-binding protein [Rubrivivax sp.]
MQQPTKVALGGSPCAAFLEWQTGLGTWAPDLCRLSTAAVAACLGLLPLVAQPAERNARIGMLCSVSCDAPLIDDFRQALGVLGWVEGRNLVIERRAAAGRLDQLPVLAREIVATEPEVVIGIGPQSARAAKDAAGAIPVVFLAVADPVAVGLVASLARPGGNVTGMATLAPGGFIAKSIELAKELVPGARRVAVLLNSMNDVLRIRFPAEAPQAAERLGLQLQVLDVQDPSGIASAIEAAVRERADVLYIPGDPLFHTPAQRVPDLANRAGLPTVFILPTVVEAGGLMSYGPDFADLFKRGAGPVDKILRGAKPGDLPVEQPTRYLLVINLKTAKALRIKIPQSLLLRADEVIQ